MKEIDDLRFLIASARGLDMISPIAADILQKKVDELENSMNIKIEGARIPVSSNAVRINHCLSQTGTSKTVSKGH